MAGEPTITVVGFVGADAEYRHTEGKTPVTTFNVANTPVKKVNGEWTNGDTTWFRVFVWNKEAIGAANEIKKGTRVIVEGRFAESTWTDSEGNVKRNLEIHSNHCGIIPRYIAEPALPIEDTRSIEDPINPTEFPF